MPVGELGSFFLSVPCFFPYMAWDDSASGLLLTRPKIQVLEQSQRSVLFSLVSTRTRIAVQQFQYFLRPSKDIQNLDLDGSGEREIKLRGGQFTKAQAQRADMSHRRQILSATCHGALERN